MFYKGLGGTEVCGSWRVYGGGTEETEETEVLQRKQTWRPGGDRSFKGEICHVLGGTEVYKGKKHRGDRSFFFKKSQVFWFWEGTKKNIFFFKVLSTSFFLIFLLSI